MTKDELIKRLDELGNLNAKSNPLAAGVLFALSGLCIDNNEYLLAEAIMPLVNEYLSNLKAKMKAYEN